VSRASAAPVAIRARAAGPAWLRPHARAADAEGAS
jgi:hypothetical protein